MSAHIFGQALGLNKDLGLGFSVDDRIGQHHGRVGYVAAAQV